MTTIARAVELARTRRVLKHAVHDQSTHGNRDAVHYLDVAGIAIDRGADPFFSSRIADMASHAATVTGHPNSDRELLGFTSIRVAKGWPLRGSITLVREDGAKFRLHMGKGKRGSFKVDRIEKHQGPGDHKGGTPQTTHGRGARDSSAADIKETTEEQGGMTIRTMSGERPESGFAVATQKNELKVPKARASEKKIRGYIREHWDALSKPGTFLGTWVNDETGQVVFDTVQVFDSKGSYVQAFEQALRIGKKGGEDAIYDLKNDVEISLSDEAAIDAYREKIAA